MQGIFRCSIHKFSTKSDLKSSEQEDQWYEHLREVSHQHSGKGQCEQCGKEISFNVTAKIPKPSGERKNPRKPVVFCGDKCRGEFLGVSE